MSTRLFEGPQRLHRLQRWLVLILVAAVALASVKAPYPDVAPLHHIPTVLVAIAALWLLARWPLSNNAVICLFIFLLLHTLGGRYTYTNVPYDAWSEALTGRSISETFGFTRNHYDRLVHFSFGALVVPALAELWRRHLGMPPLQALLFAIESIFAISALYEIFEWLLSLLVAGPLANDYNGQQGDLWDAQRDMLLAGLGAAMTAIPILKVRRT